MNSLEDDEDLNAALSAAVGDHLHKQEQHSNAREAMSPFSMDSKPQSMRTNQQSHHTHLPISQPRGDREYVQHDTRRVFKKLQPLNVFAHPQQRNNVEMIESSRYKNNAPIIPGQRNSRAVSYESGFHRELRMDFRGDFRAGRYMNPHSPERRKILHQPSKEPREWDLPKIRPNLQRRPRIRHSSARSRQLAEQKNSFDEILLQHKKLQSEIPSDYYKSNPLPIKDEKINNVSLPTQQPQPGHSSMMSQETVEIDGRHFPLADIKTALKNAFQHQFTDMVDKNTPQQPVHEPQYAPAGQPDEMTFIRKTPILKNKRIDISQNLNASVKVEEESLEQDEYPTIPFFDNNRTVEYIPQEDQITSMINEELLSEEEDDEELLRLRLLALSSAYSRNIIPPKQEKSTKKKNKKKKVSKKLVPVKRKNQQKRNLVINKSKLNSIKKQNNNRKRTNTLTPVVLDPDLLTLGSVIRRMKREQSNHKEIKTENNGKEINTGSAMNAGTSLDNYEIVEMDLDSPNNEGDPQTTQPVPPGTEEAEKQEKTADQETVWELLDLPVPKPEIAEKAALKNPELAQEKFGDSMPPSPSDFLHAFVTAKSGSVGLDSDLLCSTRQHDLSANIEDLDQSKLSVVFDPSTSTPVTDKRASTEDIELLREHLLKDLSKKRTNDNLEVVTTPPNTEEVEKTEKKLINRDQMIKKRIKGKPVKKTRNKKPQNPPPNLVPVSKIFENKQTGYDGLLPNPDCIFGPRPPGFPPQFAMPGFPFNIPPPTYNSNFLPSTSNAKSINEKFNGNQNLSASKSTILTRLGPPVASKQRLIHPPVVIDFENCSSEEDEDSFKMDLEKVIKNARAQVRANDISGKIRGNAGTSVAKKPGSPQKVSTSSLQPENSKVPVEKLKNATISIGDDQSTTAKTTTIKSTDNSKVLTAKPSTTTGIVFSPTRTTTIQQPENSTTRKTPNNSQVKSIGVMPENKTTKSLQISPTEKLQQAQKQAESVETVADKLQRVRELLQKDKAVVSKFKRQKVSKQDEISKMSLELKLLAAQLEKVKNQLKEENSNFSKIDKNLFEATKKMKQRQKLEVRFLSQLNIAESKDNDQLKPSEKVVVMPVKESSASDNVFVEEQKNQPLNQNVKTKAMRIEEQKKILLEKQRNLQRKKNLHEEKLKLKSTENRLKLIKQKTESKILKHSKTQQILLSRKLHKNLHSTPKKLLHSYVAAHKLTPLQSSSRSYSATIRKHRNSLSRKNSSAGVRARTKSQERVLAELRKRKLEVEKLRKKEEAETPHSTPTLRKRSRTNSITKMIKALRYDSSVTTQNKENADSQSRFSLSKEAIAKLKRKLRHRFSSANISSELESDKYFFSNLHNVPECLSQWKVNVGELARQSTFPAYKPILNNFKTELDYKSELCSFRSYRLNPYFRSKHKFTIPSSTYTNKINPNKMICRYDLTGKCHDLNCQGQHLSELSLSSNEVYLDILSYCPVLLKTENGKVINKHDSIHIKLKAAELTVEKLCGSLVTNKKGHVTSFNETCVLLIDYVNRALGNRFPHTTVFNKRSFTISKTLNEQNNKIEGTQKVRIADWLDFESETNILSEDTSRYFNEAQSSYDLYLSDINELKASLSKYPDNVELRIRLANSYQNKAVSSGNNERKNCLDMALNTLCLGIEINEQSELLWGSYLPLLSLHNSSGNVEDLEVVDQCLVLLPYSKPIWTEILKWKWPYQKLQSLYHQLVQSLVMRRQIWSTDEELKVWEEKHDYNYYSSWLLHVLVEQCYFTLVCKNKNEARKILLCHLKCFDDIRKQQQQALTSKKDVAEYPISQPHLCKAWLVYIHLIEHGSLPAAVFDDSLSEQEYGIAIGNKEIRLNLSAKFTQKPEKLQSLLKAALLSCNDLTLPVEENTMQCLPLYQAVVDVESKLEKWDAVNSTCQRLISSGCSNEGNEAASKIWVMWLQSILLSNAPVMITQMFDKAVTACPKCAKLSYMAAMYQLNSTNTDVEAALLYLETCVTGFIDIGEKESLTVLELHQLYRKLLKHEIALPFSDKEEIKLRENISEENFNVEKTYLWLLYCILNDLLLQEYEKVPTENDKVFATSDLYEAALFNTLEVEERKVIWTEYILFERSSACHSERATQSTSRATESTTNNKQAQQQMLWMKKFTSLVKRCLNNVPKKFTEDKLSFVDYSFHNEIASIYLGCFHGSQYSTALTMLTEFMPNNIPLLCRASSYFLKEGNSSIVTSLLWGVTTQSTSICRQPLLWRIMAAAYVAEEKYWKALGVYKRSLAAMSKHHAVWKEIVSLALLCGDNVDLDGVNPKFSNLFGETLQSMTEDVIKSMQ